MTNTSGSPLRPSSSRGVVSPLDDNRLPLTFQSLTCDTDNSGNADCEAMTGTQSGTTTNVAPTESPRLSTPKHNIAVIVPRGYKLRDEFVCPITRELIVDPVIAADGHTYDMSAIERWLQSHSTSPKTGQPLEHLHLVPNHNLQRLLRDMLREGGQALFSRDFDAIDEPQSSAIVNSTSNRSLVGSQHVITPGPQLALVREFVLKCKCLGPMESDWMGRTFRVDSNGVVGGRRRPDDLYVQSQQPDRREFVQFSDATVSRKHFEIVFVEEKQKFAIRDLGSAGGTFVRIPPCKPVAVKPGMRIMLGKHQLEVLEPSKHTTLEDTPAHRLQDQQQIPGTAFPAGETAAPSTGNTLQVTGSERQANLEETAANTDVNTPKYSEIAAVMNGVENRVFFGSRTDSFRTTLQSGAVDTANQGGKHSRNSSWKNNSRQTIISNGNDVESSTGEGSAGESNNELQLDQELSSQSDGTSLEGSVRGSPRCEGSSTAEDGAPIVALRCFAPEGTPIQGREYLVGKAGATIGRKAQNTISFCHRIGDSVVGIDSSISGEHATMFYNENLGVLELCDGTKSRGKPSGSTNGTWIRLSGLHKESDLHYLNDKTEILIGTVRFLVSIEEVIVERDIFMEGHHVRASF